jgi:hypothetical protein
VGEIQEGENIIIRDAVVFTDPIKTLEYQFWANKIGRKPSTCKFFRWSSLTDRSINNARFTIDRTLVSKFII